MKDRDDKDRDSKKDTAEDFGLTDISDEDMLVEDGDIIGFPDDSPVTVEHTDETLDTGETEPGDSDISDIIDAETIIAPSDFGEPDTLMPDKYHTEDAEAQLKIGDVLDIDAQMVIDSEDGDETISGLDDEELSELEENGSDTSERIIVTEKTGDMIPGSDMKTEADEAGSIADDIIQEYKADKSEDGSAEEPFPEESEDEILELGEEAIADTEEEEEETIELFELAEEIDKEGSEIRDIDDIIGLGAEILEDTRELIVPIGFHPSEDSQTLPENDKSSTFTPSEKEMFEEEDSTDDVMSEVEKMLAAQEETQIIDMEEQTEISSDNIRETLHLSDMPDGDISEIIEKSSGKMKTESSETDIVSDMDRELPEIEAKTESEAIRQFIETSHKLSDISAEEDILDVDAATIIASSPELADISQCRLIEEYQGEDGNLPDIDLDLEPTIGKSSEEADAEEEILDTDAATIIAPSQELTDISQFERCEESQSDGNLPDIDFDLEPTIGKSSEEDDAEEEILDTDAATIIASPQELTDISQLAEHPPEEDENLLDIDLDLEYATDKFSEEADAEEEILDTDAATIIASPQELTDISQIAEHPPEEDENLLDIDLDLESATEAEEILDADVATIIASPQELDKIQEPVRQIPTEDHLLDIDLEVQRLVRKASDDIEDMDRENEDISDAATVIAMPEDISALSKADMRIKDIPEEDIFDLSPETIVSQPTSRDSTTQKLDSESYRIIEKETDDPEMQDIETVILPREEEEHTETLRITPEPSPKPLIREKTVPRKEKDDFAKEVLKEMGQLPIKKELPVGTLPKAVEKRELPFDILAKTEEELLPDPDILEGEIFEEEEKELLKFLEMDLTPTDIPEAKESGEEDQGLGEEDEYVPIEEVMKNSQERAGTVAEEIFRPAFESAEHREDSVCLSITPEQMEAALERVIQKVFSEKIEHIVTQVIEKTFTEELEKKLRIILMQDDDSRR